MNLDQDTSKTSINPSHNQDTSLANSSTNGPKAALKRPPVPSPANKRIGTMMKYTGEEDDITMPKTKNPMDWRVFNTDFWSTDR